MTKKNTKTTTSAAAITVAREPPCTAEALVEFLDELDALAQDFQTTKLALDACDVLDVEAITATLQRLNERFVAVKREFCTNEVRL